MAKKRRGRGEGAIKQRGPDCWEARISVGYASDGKRLRKVVYGVTKTEVIQKIAELKCQPAAGTDATRYTLQQWLRHWLEAAQTTIATSTWELYDELARLYVEPRLGHVRLQQLTALHIEKLYADLVKADKSLWRCRSIGTMLSAALNQAVSRNLLPRNPVKQVRKPKPTAREIHPLRDEEAVRFLAALAKHRLHALFVLALGSGMRQGEILGLPWRNVNPEKAEMSVLQSLAQTAKGMFLKEPKSARSRRRLQLPRFVVQALETHRQRMRAEGWEVEGDARVFPSRAGGWIHRSDMRRYVFKPALQRAGVPDIRFHDLRHTHATSLLRQGKSIKAVSYRLGHASVELTLRVYAHVLPADDQELADTLDAIYGR